MIIKSQCGVGKKIMTWVHIKSSCSLHYSSLHTSEEEHYIALPVAKETKRT